MGPEIWQFVFVAVAGAVVVVLRVLFVYMPCRTGEDSSQEPPEGDRRQDHEGHLRK